MFDRWPGRLVISNWSSVVVAPIEPPAEDPFDNPVIGACGRSHANAEVDLPFWRNIQIDGREDLLLLVVKAGDVRQAAVVGVVLNAARDDLCEVPADFYSG